MDAKELTTAEIRATMTDEQILLERKLTCEAINGAIAFGYQNSNSPPSENHWLAPFWKIGRQQAELESRAALPSDAAQSSEEMIRFCPDCGLLGEIPEGYQACCPDSSHARVVPKRFAELCAETFKLCVSQPFKSSAVKPDERAAFREAMHPLPCEWSERDQKFIDAGVQLAWHAWKKARAIQQATKGDERAVAIREVAAYINKKADDYALEYGSDDMGALSFGTGKHAQDKHEYHSNLLELAEEVEALAAATPHTVAGSAGQAPTLAVWYGSMPESNGKSNWTAILHNGDMASGMTIDRSEYPERVRYEADRVRWLIGELDAEPFILDYDADKHSGYKTPTAPSLTTDAGAVLTSDQHNAIEVALAWVPPSCPEVHEVLRALLAAHPTEQRMSDAELEQFLRMDEQFSDCNETDVDHSLLLKWVRDGLLDCTHYVVTDKGNAVIAAARGESHEQ